MDVVLSNAECRAAAYVGLNRRLDAMRDGRVEVYGSAAHGGFWNVDIEAAAAELAVAKALGTFWAAADTPDEDRAGDVGPGVQVRHTQHLNGSLIVHDRDADDHRFVLVDGAMPMFRIAGWAWGRDAKHADHWRADMPRPAFFMPQSALTAMSS